MFRKNQVRVVIFNCLWVLFVSNIFAQNNNLIIKSAGCKTEFFLIEELAEAYKEKTGIIIQAGKTGNKKAVNFMLEEKTEFAFTCQPINKLSKKLKLNTDKIKNWESIPIAKDPIVLISHPQNGVKNLSISQITDIFSGKVKNWKEVGGNDLIIKVAYLDLKLESGVVTVFKESTGGKNMKLRTDATSLKGPSQLGNYVHSTAGAVTFVGFNSYQKEYGIILSVNGVKPNPKTITSGEYLIKANYYLTVDLSNKKVADFVNFCISKEGEKIISKNFFLFSK